MSGAISSSRCEICRAPVGAGEELCERCAGRMGLGSKLPSGSSLPPKKYGTASSSAPPAAIVETKLPAADPDISSLKVPAISASPAKKPEEGLPVAAGPAPRGIRPGILLEGKYELCEELGQGSMGIVYEAMDTKLMRKVAVKFLLSELSKSDEYAQRFRQEAVAMAAINDPNVAQIFTYGEQDGTPYFVMEHLDGKTLQDVVDEYKDEGGYLPVRDCLDIIWQVLGGLSEIHRTGAVHRDIKPANIMLSGDPPRARILDFGLVRDVRMANDTIPLAGTPAYIAPELVEGKKGADRSPLVDVYSAGASAYEILTGTIPFVGESWFEIMQKHVTDIPVRPSKRREDLPRSLDDIVLKAMAKNPDRRFQSCEEFLRALMMIEDEIPQTEERPLRVSGVFPSARRISSNAPGAAAMEAARCTEKKIRAGRLLVVDTDPEFRGLIRGTAKATVPMCDVQATGDGMAALDSLGVFNPSVVFLDFSRPESAGAEMAAAIRANPEFAQTAIVAVGREEEKLEEEMLEWLGIDYHLSKPVEIDTLAGFLKPLLTRGPGQISTPRV